MQFVSFSELEVIIVVCNYTTDIPDQTHIKHLLRLTTLPSIGEGVKEVEGPLLSSRIF